MQGFFTKTYATGKSITLAASARVHNNIHARYKSENIIPLVRLTLTRNSHSGDETVVRFDPLAKADLDYDFDAPKMFLSSSNTQIYSSSGEINYVINGQPLPSEVNPVIIVPIAVNLTTDTIHTLSAPVIQGLPANTCVFFKDMVSGYTLDLAKNSLNYKFSAATGLINDRFFIHAVITSSDSPSASDDEFKAYSANGFINILPLGESWNGKIGSVRVFDITGRLLTENSNLEFFRNSLLQVPAPGNKGIFLVEIMSDRKRHVAKIIIR
jgi:hypothetical protein